MLYGCYAAEHLWDAESIRAFTEHHIKFPEIFSPNEILLLQACLWKFMWNEPIKVLIWQHTVYLESQSHMQSKVIQKTSY